ncbi:c-type cytochrome [Legionella fallonii]|uniref:Cytochrome c4 n=1 Tax=Legionella fallonii LLAP-10 TaxID=1212491 RepID=A0A098G2F0_9GAMM|nr:c-type cytochrome [Legionella fallonii]CEG55660.1 Cytochrome c4 [Legionella fallonii LLAP-10]
MKKLALAFILCSPLLVYGQDAPSPGQNKTQVCAACHGPQGISANPEWPNLAGQNEKYFIKQLNDIKQGTQRKSPTMTALIATLSPQDIAELAAFYAPLPYPQGSTPKQFLQRGEQIYRGGDFDKHITACIACHGPKGTGNAQAGFPVLSGQHAAYTLIQLRAFKNGKRTNDLNHIMQDICSRMDEEDMIAVAHYIEGLY